MQVQKGPETRQTVVGKGTVKGAQVMESQSLCFQESSNQQQAAKRKAAVVHKEFGVIFVLQPR